MGGGRRMNIRLIETDGSTQALCSIGCVSWEEEGAARRRALDAHVHESTALAFYLLGSKMAECGKPTYRDGGWKDRACNEWSKHGGRQIPQTGHMIVES